jgi:hypothetical protein
MAKFKRKNQRPFWCGIFHKMVVLIAAQLIFGFTAFSQTISVTGKVTDANQMRGFRGQQFM